MEDATRRLYDLTAEVTAQGVILELVIADILRRVPVELQGDLAENLAAMADNYDLKGLFAGDDQASVWLSDQIVSVRERLARLVQRAVARLP